MRVIKKKKKVARKRKKIIFILGPSFSNLGLTTQLLEKKFEGKGIAFFDIEEFMKKKAERQTMFDLLLFKSREEVRKLWLDAIRDVLLEVKKANDCAVISGHSVYFNEAYNSFFSPFNERVLLQAEGKLGLRFSLIIVLFDDVFDMLNRHSQVTRGPIPQLNILETKLRKIEREESSLSEKEQRALARSDALISIGTNFLTWRRLELHTSELIAQSLGAKFIPFALKNPMNILEQIILSVFSNEERIPIAYLSHSISFFRRFWSQGKEPDEKYRSIRKAINKIPNALLYQGIAVISPTSIDELRFEKENGLFTGRLTRRWDLLEGSIYEATERLLGVRDIKQHAEYANLFYPSIPNGADLTLAEPLPEPSKPLREKIHERLLPMIEEISFQIGERDHLLVAHADLLIAFHPIREENGEVGISEGVQREVEHWKTRISNGEKKSYLRSAFIYILSDDTLTTFLSKILCDVDPTFILLTTLREYLIEKFDPPNPKDLAFELIELIWKDKSQTRHRSPLGPKIPPAIENSVRNEKRLIEEMAIKDQLDTALCLHTKNSILLLFEDTASFFANVGLLSDFLRGGSSKGPNICDIISKIISKNCPLRQYFDCFRE